MANISRSLPRIARLKSDFGRYVELYAKNPPFTKQGQLEYHVETIRLRTELGSVEKAVAEPEFIRSLYRTLGAWGIGARASNLSPFDDFAKALRGKVSEIAALQSLCIEGRDFVSPVIAKQIWKIIRSLGIVDNNAPVVAGTKTLHHILPNLVVPVDRAYTQRFFGWHNPEFQYDQETAFRESFKVFVDIARTVNPVQYVSGGWNSSRTKVIDNAIVAFVSEEQQSAS